MRRSCGHILYFVGNPSLSRVARAAAALAVRLQTRSKESHREHHKLRRPGI